MGLAHPVAVVREPVAYVNLPIDRSQVTRPLAILVQIVDICQLPNRQRLLVADPRYSTTPMWLSVSPAVHVWGLDRFRFLHSGIVPHHVTRHGNRYEDVDILRRLMLLTVSFNRNIRPRRLEPDVQGEVLAAGFVEEEDLWYARCCLILLQCEHYSPLRLL